MSVFDPDADARRDAEVRYADRVPVLREVARALCDDIEVALEDVPGVFDIIFSVMTPEVFGKKSARSRQGASPYTIPLADVEDQILCSVLVPDDISHDLILARLRTEFSLIKMREGKVVFAIPPHVVPSQWASLEDPPTMFEVQVGAPPAGSQLPPRPPSGVCRVGQEPLDLQPASPQGPLLPAKVFAMSVSLDERFWQRLKVHLVNLERDGVVQVGGSSQIVPGDDVEKETTRALEEADIVVLLISADFVASEFCGGIGLARLIERHDRGEVQIVPISIRTADIYGSPLARLQMLPRGKTPLQDLPNTEAAWVNIVCEIRKMALSVREMSVTAHASDVPAASSTRPSHIEIRKDRIG